jgi:hypothetical protein
MFLLHDKNLKILWVISLLGYDDIETAIYKNIVDVHVYMVAEHRQEK